MTVGAERGCTIINVLWKSTARQYIGLKAYRQTGQSAVHAKRPPCKTSPFRRNRHSATSVCSNPPLYNQTHQQTTSSNQPSGCSSESIYHSANASENNNRRQIPGRAHTNFCMRVSVARPSIAEAADTLRLQCRSHRASSPIQSDRHIIQTRNPAELED
jgi:hypothetical protein